jgi:hypothetical protein
MAKIFARSLCKSQRDCGLAYSAQSGQHMEFLIGSCQRLSQDCKNFVPTPHLTKAPGWRQKHHWLHRGTTLRSMNRRKSPTVVSQCRILLTDLASADRQPNGISLNMVLMVTMARNLGTA